jgi:DNA mismatch endonuclease (patch repair protein)
MVFARAKVAVFIDGCYWHGCPEHGTAAKTNPGYWASKIARNRERDVETDAQLVAAGWTVVRAWEHDDPARVAERIMNSVVST